MELNFTTNKSEDALIEQGEAARSLLGSPAYQKAVFDLTEACCQIFFTCDPDDVKRREDAYTLMRAMREISDTLKQRVDIMNDILNKRELENSIDEFTTNED